MKKRALLFLTFLVLALVGCQSKPSPRQEQRLLNISTYTEVRSLDPRIGIDYPSVYAIKMLFEGLMLFGLDNQIHNALASSYEISPDGRTYTFTLRDAYWSNGDKITAYDFEYSWKKVVDPNCETLGVHNFYPIKNVRMIINGKKPLESVGFEALDEKTFRVELEHPTPYFLEVLATPSFFPINQRVDQENPKWMNEDGPAFVCSGPFYLDSHKLENVIIVKKNPHYWDAESVRLPGIKFEVIKDMMTQLSLFEKGKLDWMGKPISKVPLDALQYLKKTGKVHFTPTYGLYWYFVNTEKFPFTNKKIRHAFASAIDRSAIIDHILQGREVPATGVLPHALAVQNGPYFDDNNPEMAKNLFEEGLKELGLDRQSFPPVMVNFATADVHLRVAEALQQQWQDVLGVSIKLEQKEWKSHYAQLQSGDFQLGGMGWQSWLRDPIYIMQTFRYKADGINMSRWENKDYKRLLLATENEQNIGKRKEQFHLAETILMEEMPVIPIYYATMCYAKNEQLKNVFLSELYDVDFRWAYFEEAN